MKLRKIILLFMIVGFGGLVETIHFGRNIVAGANPFEALSALDDLKFDGSFPFGRKGFRGPSHDFTASETVDATGVTAIEITNEYGDVTVRRTHDPKAQIGIGLRKEVFTRRAEGAESQADQVKLQIQRDGSTLRISTSRDSRNDYRIKTYFDIETPMPLDTKITNAHGKIVVEGAKSVDLSGEYDTLRAVDISGDCNAKNRHGDLEVISAALGCRVQVEYGDVHAEKLLASSKIDVTHGGLNAVEIGALVTTLKFGDLQAQKINGSLTANGEHSSLKIDDVKGDVQINNQGDIDIQNILGRVSIDNQRGHVKLLKAALGVLIKNTYEEVAATDVGGLLEINNQHGSIRAQRFVKGATLETDSEDVDVSDYAGPLNITTKRGDVSVKPLRKGLAAIDVSVDIGDVSLALPESVNALLDASVERGDVEGTLGALKSSEQGKRMLKATIGNGGPLLRLRSRLGNIKLSSEDNLEVSEPDSPEAPEIDLRSHPAPPSRLGADPLPVPAKAIAPAPIAMPRPAAMPKPAQAPAPPVKPSPESR